MTNCINLGGDGDEFDVLHDVERAFGVRLTKEEAEAPRTVGQLRDLIEAKAGHVRTENCLTQSVFYRIRTALAEMNAGNSMSPDTPVSVVAVIEGRTLRHKWRALAERSGLTLPPLELPWRHSDAIVVTLAMALVLSGAACVSWAWSIGDAIVSTLLLFPVATILSAEVLHRLVAAIPRRIVNLGDLAREAAGYSFSKLVATKPSVSPHDRWFALTAILRSVTGYTGSIDRDTTFFPSR